MKVREYFEKGTGERREEVLLSRTEQQARYQECLQAVHDNPGWYLDHLEGLSEFKVGWQRYGKRKVYKRNVTDIE